jgi:hypothetical protein
MRRSLLAGIGVAAVLIFAACTPDQTRQEPLAPTDVGFAKGGGGGSGQCGGGLASDIAKLQDELFDGADETLIESKFDAIKTACPVADGAQVLMDYLDVMTAESGAPNNNATKLVDLLGKVTLYATGTALVRPAEIFQVQGGAAVLSPGEFMTTFDSRARLEVQDGALKEPPVPNVPGGPHLWTIEPRATGDCDGTTSLRITGKCYQIHDYPDETVAYSPPFIVTLCLHSDLGASGIGHQAAAFNGKAEVLPETSVAFSCAHTESALNSWLGREAGPVGRALAKAYDYLRPRPLFADDAGESGLGLFTSLFGGVLNDVFADDFDDPTTFNAQSSTPPIVTDTPDLGEGTWAYSATSPGFIKIQDALGGLSGGVLVLNQAQGNCANCPTFQLVGTRVNGSEAETVGSYNVIWTSSQTKPSVKEAPFIVFNANNSNNEIARLAYVSLPQPGNRLILTVRQGNGPNDVITRDVGPWVTNGPQTFTLTVNLTTLDPDSSHTVSLAINGVPVANAQGIPAPRATTLKQIGYVLTGIDAGIIASDTWKVTRLSDIPPQ